MSRSSGLRAKRDFEGLGTALWELLMSILLVCCITAIVVLTVLGFFIIVLSIATSLGAL